MIDKDALMWKTEVSSMIGLLGITKFNKRTSEQSCCKLGVPHGRRLRE